MNLGRSIINNIIILTFNRNKLLNSPLITNLMRVYPQLKCIRMHNTPIHRVINDNLMINNHHLLEAISETFKEIRILQI
jgi:hypothetical protein